MSNLLRVNNYEKNEQDRIELASIEEDHQQKANNK